MLSQQRIQNYSVSLDFESDNISDIKDIPCAAYTPPTIQNANVSRPNQKRGQQVLYGHASYSEFSITIDLKLSTGGESNLAKATIQSLQQMENLDLDTVNVRLTPIESFDSEVKPTYITVCSDCILVSIKYDDMDRNSESTPARAVISLLPANVATLTFGENV